MTAVKIHPGLATAKGIEVRFAEHVAGSFFARCRCGAVVRGADPEDVSALMAGHWMFDEDHKRFAVANPILPRGRACLSDEDERADYLGIEP